MTQSERDCADIEIKVLLSRREYARIAAAVVAHRQHRDPIDIDKAIGDEAAVLLLAAAEIASGVMHHNTLEGRSLCGPTARHLTWDSSQVTCVECLGRLDVQTEPQPGNVELTKNPAWVRLREMKCSGCGHARGDHYFDAECCDPSRCSCSGLQSDKGVQR